MSYTNLYGTNGWGPLVSIFQQNKYPQYKSTFTGNASDVNYSASVYWANGWDVTITQGNPYTMDVSLNVELQSNGITPVTGSATYITKNWSLKYNTCDKEITHCDASINDQDKRQLDYLIANPPTSSTAVNWAANFSTSSTSLSASQAVYNLYIAGFTKVPISTPVFHLSMIIPSTYDLTAFLTNTYAIYTKATLCSQFGVPSNWQNGMPMGSDPASSTTYGIQFHYGYLKQPATIDQNGSSAQINQEWIYGLWPANIYGSTL